MLLIVTKIVLIINAKIDCLIETKKIDKSLYVINTITKLFIIIDE